MTADVSAPPAPAEGYGQSTKRERVGWYFYDWANSAFSTTVVTAFLGPYLTAIAENGADPAGDVHLLGMSFKAGSLFAYTTSLSVLLQVLLLPVVGAIADRAARKKVWLAVFAYIGAAATCGLVFLTGDRYQLGAALFFIANLSFGASIVVYNSFLPQISDENERDGVSSRGWAFGYLGGGLLLLLNVIVVLIGGEENQGEIARWSLVSAGVWWAAFTTLPLLWLRDRPSPAGTARGSVLIDGFKQLKHTLKEMRAFPLTLFFLGAFLIYNDGIQTVIAMAGTYGSKQLGFDNTVLMPTILMVQFLAFAGAMLLGRLAKTFGAWKTVLGSLVGWTGILIAAFFLPYGQAVPFVILGGAIGLVLGGSQALSRSLFSQLIPRGKEGEYFGLYEISDKGTSWLGPLLFGLAYDLTGSYRVAIISLIVFFVAGFIMLMMVPMARAIAAVGNTPPEKL
ncbi:MFS transporter [Catellatospora methionotrophica]|uniref:MFS transporter n=1 Tax=Catellatospora methionotrophica TaxID=121620 RepID=A0A8J3LDZ6_9ACTN|nr:MFS transporter [Catellatospora methionotrophica]GIG18957.1 MFS transporter [Catellatospora methionotrophica]